MDRLQMVIWHVARLQMVIVSDPNLIDSVVGRSTELEKSTEVFYSQFNVVAPVKGCVVVAWML